MSTRDVWGDDAPLGRRGLLADVALGGFVLLVGVVVGYYTSTWSVLVAVGIAIAVAIRRVRPLLAGGIAFAAGLAQTLVDQPNPAVVALALIAFALGADRAARTRWTGAVLSAVGIITATVWASRLAAAEGSRPDLAGLSAAASSAIVLLGGWVGGYVRWQRREALRARVAEQVAAVEERRLRDLVDQERERSRIAADMHDVIAHSWAVVAAQADGARYLLRTEPERAESALAVIGDTARSAMEDVRHLLDRLRNSEGSGSLEDGPDLDELLQRLRAAGMRVERRRLGPVPQSSPVVAVAARVLAECLTNALKHGDLTHPVRVVEEWGTGCRLEVVNAVPPDARAGSGHGLLGIRERLAEVGGTLTCGPGDRGATWRVVATIPPTPLTGQEKP